MSTNENNIPDNKAGARLAEAIREIYLQATDEDKATAEAIVTNKELAVVSISGHVASVIASDYNGRNRPISIPRVGLYSNSMLAEGEWLDGEMKLFEDNTMADGQHRMIAMAMATLTNPDISFQFVVKPNIKRSQMYAIDSGKSRTLKDFIALDGYSHANMKAIIVSRTAPLLYELDYGSKLRNVTIKGRLDYVAENDDVLNASITVAKQCLFNIDTPVLTQAEIATGIFMLIMGGYDKKQIATYYQDLLTGNSTYEGSPQPAIYKLLKKQLEVKTRAGVLAPVTKLGTCIRGMFYTHQGKAIKKSEIPWNPKKDTFPTNRPVAELEAVA